VARIVRAMKDFSHPGQGCAETDLNRAVESTAQVSRSEWKYVAELDLELDPSVGLVRCYEGELKQAVLNIIVNAAQAIGEDRSRSGRTELGKIRVGTRRDGSVVRISVTDDGPGMDEATRARVFDPFFTTKEVGRGSGQGLTISHASIVTKHGGSIDIASAPGAGTTFTISIPDVAEGTEQ
jgi:two-component system, NtrC family, sensor kinase